MTVNVRYKDLRVCIGQPRRIQGQAVARILVIDDDETSNSCLSLGFGVAGHETVCAITGKEGVSLAKRFEPQIALVDMVLPDMSGIRVVERLRAGNCNIPCIAITGYQKFEFARDAVRVGIVDWLDKPVSSAEILASVERALGPAQSNGDADPSPAPHAAMRLAEVCVHFLSSREDKPNLDMFGREVGHAPGCLRNWCRTAGISAKSFRDFARALRVIHWRNLRQLSEVNLLSVVDVRTFRKLRLTSGGTEGHFPQTIADFLRDQQLIGNVEFVRAVEVALIERGVAEPIINSDGRSG